MTTKKNKTTTSKSLPPGVQELKFMDPKALKANTRNWRVHSQRQRQAFQGLLKAHGWAGAALLNLTTGNLLDGHMRVSEAIKAGIGSVPVLVGHWTEEQERHILATFDPLGAMAGTNAAALQSLTHDIAKTTKTLENLTSEHSTALKKLNRDLSSYAAAVELDEAPAILLDRTKGGREKVTPEVVDPNEDDTSIMETRLKDDVVFDTDNPWGLPLLRDDALSTVVPRTTWNRTPESVRSDAWYCYSAGPNTLPAPEDRNGGVLGFFTEDFRFEMAWNDSPAFTERLILQDWAGVALPDFSTWASWPFPVRLHNLYRSRWCGRYWQEAGIPIIPLIQSIGDGPEHLYDSGDYAFSDIVLDSLPQEIPVAALQVRTAEKQNTDYWSGVGDMIRTTINQLRIHHLVIYGGLEYSKYLLGHLPKTKKTEFVLIDGYITKRRAVMKSK